MQELRNPLYSGAEGEALAKDAIFAHSSATSDERSIRKHCFTANTCGKGAEFDIGEFEYVACKDRGCSDLNNTYGTSETIIVMKVDL